MFAIVECGDGTSVDPGKPELAVWRQGNFEAALAAGREADVCLGEDASILGNDGGEVEAIDLGGEGRRDLAAGNDDGKLEVGRHCAEAVFRGQAVRQAAAQVAGNVVPVGAVK